MSTAFTKAVCSSDNHCVNCFLTVDLEGQNAFDGTQLLELERLRGREREGERETCLYSTAS